MFCFYTARYGSQDIPAWFGATKALVRIQFALQNSYVGEFGRPCYLVTVEIAGSNPVVAATKWTGSSEAERRPVKARVEIS